MVGIGAYSQWPIIRGFRPTMVHTRLPPNALVPARRTISSTRHKWSREVGFPRWLSSTRGHLTWAHKGMAGWCTPNCFNLRGASDGHSATV